MSNTSQLAVDLTEEARGRLKVWVKDTIMRCDAVDLGDKEQIGIIMSALIGEYLHIYSMNPQANRDDFLRMQGMLYDAYYANADMLSEFIAEVEARNKKQDQEFASKAEERRYNMSRKARAKQAAKDADKIDGYDRDDLGESPDY